MPLNIDAANATNPKVGRMDIGDAIRELRRGLVVTRRGWNGRGTYIGLCEAGRNPYHPQTAEYVYFVLMAGDRVPWVASQTDLLATDWEIATVR